MNGPSMEPAAYSGLRLPVKAALLPGTRPAPDCLPDGKQARRSRLSKTFYLIGGFLALGLGGIGIVLPLFVFRFLSLSANSASASAFSSSVRSFWTRLREKFTSEGKGYFGAGSRA